MGSPPDHSARSFQFERDTFVYANELVWEYRLDPETGTMTSRFNQPVPTYIHRCFVMVRSARQFFYHARFDAGLPAGGSGDYRRLVREIVSRNLRRASAECDRVVMPGYDCLRAFSRAHEPLLKAELRRRWQSYFLRSHWRMVFRSGSGIRNRWRDKLSGRCAKAAWPSCICSVSRASRSITGWCCMA